MFTLLAEQNANLSDGIVLAIVGMVVVFVALSVLAIIITALTRLIPPPAPEVVAPANTGLDGRKLAIIAAAATTIIGQNVRIERVQPVDSP